MSDYQPVCCCEQFNVSGHCTLLHGIGPYEPPAPQPCLCQTVPPHASCSFRSRGLASEVTIPLAPLPLPVGHGGNAVCWQRSWWKDFCSKACSLKPAACWLHKWKWWSRQKDNKSFLRHAELCLQKCGGLSEQQSESRNWTVVLFGII
jgi:hypothetical protein